ncbi:iron chelate uptake ABC transporter family permease subunit [Leucothrix mucor]|uniref:iron chelate uptake ABC transporter family permease subunit n=1 Tax=Leucothrix mucor TaxID=45248 RepID=UPI0003B4F4D6|nr:iron chelate uptake ABC transporter family permease subunit [Leucothrix mucor]
MSEQYTRARHSKSYTVVWLTLISVLVCLIYLFQGAEGNKQFIITFRLPTLIGLVITAAAIGVSTILFQTLSSNRILTPSLMGFDSLYVLLQTSVVFLFSALDYVSLPTYWKFFGELILMTLLSVALFSTLLTRLQADFSRMILTGIIFGILFRSLSGFMGRVMSPNDYAVVQSASYARFSNIDESLLVYAAAIVLLALLLIASIHRKLDVMALGRDISIGLGVNHRNCAFQVLTLIALLVATATALVGPVVFLGLLISSLVYRLTPNQSHANLLPLSIVFGVLVVVGGQLLLERLLNLQVTISIVIELIGGLVFIYLILRRQR